MGSKQQAMKSAAQAKYMKEKGIYRKQGRCGVCDKMVGIPMDNHLNTCSGPRRKSIR